MIQQQNTNDMSHLSPIQQTIHSMFSTILSPSQLSPIVQLQKDSLLQLLSQGSNLFYKNLQKKQKRILIFLANYHKLVHTHSLESPTQLTNHMSLHFINLLGYSRLKYNQFAEAKNIYKNVWQYVGIKGCDKVLMSIALNNLGFLHLKNNRPFKSLQCHLKVIQLMGKRLSQLKRQRNKNQLIEDSVILISSLIHCRKTLKHIISEQPKTNFYNELFVYVNEIGYKCSRKYLGEKSNFTKVFKSHCHNDSGLPVIMGQSEDQSVERSTLEQKILSQLQSIYEVLKTKRQPQIVYVKEQKQVIQPIQTTVLQQLTPAPDIQIVPLEPQNPYLNDDVQSSAQQSFTINGWTVVAYFLRPKEVFEKIKQNQLYQELILGTLAIQWTKTRRNFKTIISPDRLQKIIALVDFQTSASSDYLKKTLRDQELLNLLIFPHMDIDDDGNMDFLVKKTPILKPFLHTFLEEQSIIFFHHIEKNNFRLNISPSQNSQTLSLDIIINQASINRLFSVKQRFPRFIVQSYEKIKQLYYEKQIQIPQMNNYEETQIVLINENELKNALQSLLRDFQLFILEAEQQDQGSLKLSDYFNVNENEEFLMNSHFSFFETNQNLQSKSKLPLKNKPDSFLFKGQFTQCKYLPNISSIEVFCQNDFSTYNIESHGKAKGTTMIYDDRFEKQFGVSLKIVEKEGLMQSLLEMLSKRYVLKVFHSHLKTHDEQLYNQNAIHELTLTCKGYKRIVVRDEDGYLIPVTISQLSINGTIPMALRIDVYFPCQGCAQYSVLVKVRESLWMRPVQRKQMTNESKQNQNVNEQEVELNGQMQMNKQKQEKKIEYFLNEWCQIEGNQLLMKNIQIQGMQIRLKGSLLRFFSLQRILHHLL